MFLLLYRVANQVLMRPDEYSVGQKGSKILNKNGTISKNGLNSSTKMVPFQAEKGQNSSTKMVPFQKRVKIPQQK